MTQINTKMYFNHFPIFFLLFNLQFTEVKYKVIMKGVTSTTKKDILHGITGSASPGEV